jgi:hypothetical protein
MSDLRSEASLTRFSWSAQARLITGRKGVGTSIKDTEVKRSVPVVVLALFVAACGGGSNAGVASLDDTATTSTTTAEGAAASTEEALLTFTECLREHGLEVDDPDFDGTGGFGLLIPGGGGADGDSGAAGPDDDTQAAMEACQPLLEGIRSQFNDFDPSQLEDQLYAFAECMRDEGVDWPDPDLTAFAPGGGAAGPPGGGEPGEGPNQGGGPFAGNGVDLEDPLVQAALETCQSDVGFGLPGGGPGGTPPGGEG